MTNDEHAAALTAALALIGTERAPCPTCGRPQGAVIYGRHPHTANSAAKACGIDPQVVYRELTRRKKEAAA